MPFVADTLLRSMEGLLNRPLPHIQLIDSNITRKYSRHDKELESTCNLLFPLRHPKMPWPKYTLSQIPRNYQKPNLLVIADSYFTLLEDSPFTEAFGNVDYWKYNETSYSKIPERHNQLAYIDRYAAITDADVVMVMFTTMFAYDYMFGFMQTALTTFSEGDIFNGGEYVEKQISQIIERIKNDPKWLKMVKLQAEEEHISLDEALRNNAKYVYETDFYKH
jgi:hypothetical protein